MKENSKKLNFKNYSYIKLSEEENDIYRKTMIRNIKSIDNYKKIIDISTISSYIVIFLSIVATAISLYKINLPTKYYVSNEEGVIKEIKPIKKPKGLEKPDSMKKLIEDKKNEDKILIENTKAKMAYFDLYLKKLQQPVVTKQTEEQDNMVMPILSNINTSQINQTNGVQ